MHSDKTKAFAKYLFAAFVIIVCLFGYILTGCGNGRDDNKNDRSGVYLIYRAVDTNTDNFDAKMEDTCSELKNILANKGYSETTVVRVGTYIIRVEVSDVDDPSAIYNIIGEPTAVKFVLDSTNETIVTSDNVVSADAYYDPSSGYVVKLVLDAEGRKKFGDATSNNINGTMSIYLGDSTTPISSPTINSAITNGEAIITGFTSRLEAEELAKQIMSGTLNLKLDLVEQGTLQTNTQNRR